MIKVKNETCDKCGMEIEFPDYDISRPCYDYRPKVERAIFKHFWQHHREDFPPQFKSLTQFLKWLRTPEGQGLIAETREELNSDATEAGNDKNTKWANTPWAHKERVVIKVKNHICSKCGLPIEVPDYDETRPISEYFPKWDRVVLKHGWQHHREDFPPQFKSFTQFMKWITTPEGKEWNQKQGLIADAERIVRNSLSEGGSKE